MKHLWVVEMRVRGKWLPTAGVGLYRRDGRRELDEWRMNNHIDKFRLVKYVSSKGEA